MGKSRARVTSPVIGVSAPGASPNDSAGKRTNELCPINAAVDLGVSDKWLADKDRHFLVALGPQACLIT